MSFRCNSCNAEWNQELLPDGPMEVSAFTRSLRKLTCPHCGADWTSIRVLFSGHNPNAKDRDHDKRKLKL